MYYLRTKAAVDAIKFTHSARSSKKKFVQEPNPQMTVSDLRDVAIPKMSAIKTSGCTFQCTPGNGRCNGADHDRRCGFAVWITGIARLVVRREFDLKLIGGKG